MTKIVFHSNNTFTTICFETEILPVSYVTSFLSIPCLSNSEYRGGKTRFDMKECMTFLKPTKCEGYDRIPVSMLYDASEILFESFLFQKVYANAEIPEQWKISKSLQPLKRELKIIFKTTSLLPTFAALQR